MTGRPNGLGRSSRHPGHRSVLALLLLVLGASACDRGRDDDEFSAIRDTTSLVESMGDVSLTTDGAIRGEVTSGMYRRWMQARQALQGAGISLPNAQALRGYDNDDVRRLVSRLEKNSRARSAISGAGMSVEEFVVTGVALERQLALATGPQRRAIEEAAAAAPPQPAGTDPIPGTLAETLLIPSPTPLPPPRQETVPARPVPVDPQPTPTPRVPVETLPRPRDTTPAPVTPRPAPRDTLRIEPVPAPEPTRPPGSEPPRSERESPELRGSELVRSDRPGVEPRGV